MDVPLAVVEACKRGDPDAFDQLVRLTHRDVYSLALRIVGNPDDAAEVAQDTYLKLLRSIRTFRGEARFSTWLYRVTSSVAVSSLRRRSRRKLDVPLETGDGYHDVPAPDSAGPEADLERRELGERLHAALASLPAGYRTVVVLKDVYGFSLEEIGRKMGISEGAAKVRLFRARQRLREMLYEDDPAGTRREEEASGGVS